MLSPHLQNPKPQLLAATGHGWTERGKSCTPMRSLQSLLRSPLSLNSSRPLAWTAGRCTLLLRRLSRRLVWWQSWVLARSCARICSFGRFSRRNTCMRWLGRWGGICSSLLDWVGYFGRLVGVVKKWHKIERKLNRLYLMHLHTCI